MSHENLKKNTLIGLMWKFSENFSTQFISFVIQLILARILLPEDYGIIALAAVFIMVAQVFIQTGFSSALIQKKDVSKVEYSTIFFAGIILSVILYAIIFISSPWIAAFYQAPIISLVLRLQGLTIILSALSSVQNAILVKEFEFKKSFIYRLIAVILQGIIGITMAILGYGIWSIVVSGLFNTLIITISFWIVVKWRPIFVFSYQAFKNLFAYSTQILLYSLINVLFNNLQSLIIGKQFSKDTLGYYNRGFQIPMLIMVNTDGAINSVMFSSLSKVQDDKEKFVQILRRSIKTSVFLVFPMMIGLIAVAEPLTLILLTDKWLDSVPFLQITSLICLTWPFSLMHHALNAQKLPKLSLWLNMISKVIAIVFLLISLRYGVLAFVLSAFFSSVISVIIGFFVNRKIYNYTILTQILDFLPSLIIAIFMGLSVYLVGLLIDMIYLKILVQLFVGVLVYGILSYLFNKEILVYLFRSGYDLIKKTS